MDSDPARAVPAKCARCERPMTTPLVCDYCKEVNAAAVGADYFSLLGLPRRFDLDADELHRKFLALNRHAHPDFHVDDSPEVRELSLRVSATVNDAYRTLADPAARAAYLLELLGGKSSADDKSVPEGFLDTMMMMQEELADAKGDGNEGELARLGRVLRTQHDGLIRRVGELFAQYDEGVGCRAVADDLLAEIRKQLNAVSYVKKLLAQL